VLSTPTLHRSPEEIADLESLATRVAAGPQLQSSPRLREFFHYVVDCALRSAPEEATEQHIGVHVFHRHPGYNSGDDSIVRSQARLLRLKLAAYFANEGADEPIIIDIPKGQYLPIFRPAGDPPVEHPPTPPATAFTAPPAAIEPTQPAALARHLRLTAITASLALFLLIAGAAGGFLLRTQHDFPSTPLLDSFWGPFYRDSETLVIYSNPAFQGTPYTGLKLLTDSPASDPDDTSASVDETYTGTGEVAAVQQLTHLFDAHQRTFTLKRSRLVTWDEARTRNLIFVGAPSQNTALDDLPKLTQFSIMQTPDHHGYIANLHPAPGEPASFPRISPTSETAIVALLPGLQPGTHIAIFSGLSTIGTQQAVEFLTQPASIAQIRHAEGLTTGPLRPFEAVVEVRIQKGVGIGASLLAVHPE
jgi:hypothetical protein